MTYKPSLTTPSTAMGCTDEVSDIFTDMWHAGRITIEQANKIAKRFNTEAELVTPKANPDAKWVRINGIIPRRIAIDYLHLAQAIYKGETTIARETRPANAATDKQVNLIMRLIVQGRHLEGGYFTGPVSRDEVENLTKQEASSYIDSMLGNY